MVRLLLLAALLSNAAGYDRIHGYLPQTHVVDHGVIDLDQKKMNELIYIREIGKAKSIYQKGGHSGSYASLTLTGLGGSAKTYPEGTLVIGENDPQRTNATEMPVYGVLREDVSWSELDTEKAGVIVEYQVGDSFEDYMNCQMGGLVKDESGKKLGCFKGEGTVKFGQKGDPEEKFDEYEYSYHNRNDNQNARTLRSLSTDAKLTNKGTNGEYYDEFKLFLDYYGNASYGDKWIEAAIQRQPTAFASGRGNSDFSVLTSRQGEGEAMKKGTAYLNLWMHVVKELNEAVDGCKNGADYAQHALDKAVANYVGSLGAPKESPGILLYELAHKRAHNFKTAGRQMDSADETENAWVNLEIFIHFGKMKGHFEDNRCDHAEKSKTKIVTLMKIPLIQSTLRYAYLVGEEPASLPDEQQAKRAEAATFAASILPFVHDCGEREAKVIHDNLKIDSKSVDFKSVKNALERSYECLGVTCEQIGGIWKVNAYKDGAAPCNGYPTDGGASVVGILGLTVGVLFAGWVFLRFRRKLFIGRRKQKDMPEMYTGNIAAVTEIA